MRDKPPCQECGTRSLPLLMRDRDGKQVCIPCFLNEKREAPSILAHYRALLEAPEQARPNFQRRKILK